MWLKCDLSVGLKKCSQLHLVIEFCVPLFLSAAAIVISVLLALVLSSVENIYCLHLHS